MSTPLNQLLITHAKGALKRAAVSGGFAGLLSLIALVVRGQQELAKPAAPVNAPGHWVHGDESVRADHVDAKHTLTGVVVHQASALFWGLLFDQLWRRATRRVPANPTPHLPTLAFSAAGLTAVAALVDLKLVPERLTPGFQKRLSRKGLVVVYASFAAGLALGGVLLARQRNTTSR